ncbi:Pycsar system effector family protein [Modestobacter lacusdianchii]
MTADDPDQSDPDTPTTGPASFDETGEAWKALGLVNDWVRHAETKAAATLAALGVTGGALYNLVKSQNDVSGFLAVMSTVCGAAVIVGGVFALLALRPRLRSQEDATSTLYFDHIARRHTSTDPAPYQQELATLVASPSSLVAEIAQQVWSNARVAKDKYKWSAWALIALAVALISVALVAAVLGIASLGEP